MPAPDSNPPDTAATTDAPKRLEVSAGLVFRAGLLLITQRRPQDHLGGLWEFPGGKVEPGETGEACLERELAEETGIAVKVLDFIETIEHEYPGKAVRLNFYRCEWLRGEPRKLGCHDIAWVTRAQLLEYKFPAADERLLARLINETGLWLD